MKNIIERSAGGGAKIATYLSIAVKSRLAVAALAALAAGGAWAVAPTATAVWEAGEFTETKNGYSITLPSGVSIENNNIVVSSTATAGASIDISSVIDGGATAVTVLFKYSTASTPSSSCSMAVSSSYIDSNNANGTKYDMGFINWNTSNWGLLPAWHATSTSSGYNKNSNDSPNYTTALSSSGGYVLYAYSKSASTVYGYSGSTLSNLSGGSKNGYTFSNYDGKITHVGIGGPTGQTPSNKWAVWPGMTIEKIAIFVGNAYTNEDLADYMWPSIERYQKWSYADSSRILTWITPSTADDNCIPNSATQYTVFDITNTTDTTTTYVDGRATSTTGANWHYFCYSSNVSDGYAAPGSVLRFVSGDYKKSLAADYSPVTYGGIIVEEGATGYAFASASRYSVLGDPTGETETWFEFNEDFTLGRSSGCHLTGTNNLSIASGKTFTIAGTTTKTATTAKSNVLSGTAGGTLKLHGEGKLVATLTASGATLDYTDLSATCSSSTDAYIQGTVTVNGDTVIALPSGATFPYFIAIGISGVLDSETGVTIGGVAAPNYVAKADGSIIYSAPAEVTISSDATWGSGDLDGWTTDDATKNYIINVTDDATLTLGSAVSLNRLTLNVGEGATLTISGAYTITAADCIYVTGAGIVKVTANNALSGTVRGDGTILYQYSSQEADAVPTATFTDSGWTGTLWIKDFGNESYHSNAGGTRVKASLGTMVSFGNFGSRVKFTNVKAYYQNGTVSCPWTLVLEDGENAGEYAWKNDSGWTSGSVMTIAAIEGNGTLYDGYNTCTPPLYFTNAAAFTGTIYNNGKRIAIGSGATPSSTAGTITIGANASATIASGKTWTVGGGIVVAASGSLTVAGTAASAITDNGTLTLGDAATVSGAISGEGTVVGNQCFPVPGSSFTGTLTINAASAPSYTESSATAIYGSVLNIASGMAYLFGNVTHLPDAINIANNSHLFISNADMASLKLNIDSIVGTGMLYISEQCTSLAALTINAGTNRGFANSNFAITPSTTLSTVNIVLDEVKGDGGTITLTSVTGLTAVEGRTYNFTVNCLDGRTVSGTYDGSKSTVAYAPSVSGSATLYDVTFTNTFAFAYTSKSNEMFLDRGVAEPYYNNNLNDETTGLYIRHHPYTSSVNTDLYSLENFSAVVVGQMSPTANTIFIHMGSSKSTNPGLLIATTAEKNEVIIAPNSGGTVDADNAVKVKVPNAATARHAYVITRSGTTFTVWVDGICRGNFTVSSGFKLGVSDHSGIQVGSDFGGGIKDAAVYKAVANSTSETGVVNCIRIFDHVLTEAERDQITAVYPYESKAGLYTRTVSADADLSATDAWAKDGEATLYALPASATVDGVDYDPSVTVTASAAAKLTANADLAVDTLTVEGTGTLTFDSDGTHAVSVTGAAVFNSPVVVKYGALNLSGTPVGLGSGGMLTFDCSGIDAASIYTTKHFQLTGVVKRDDAKIAATLPSAAYRRVELVYNANGYYELVVTPNHENGAEVYFKSGYLASNMNGTDSGTVYVDSAFTTQTVMFPGDTMVINNNSTLDSGTKVWIKDDFVGNIRISRTSAMSLINGGNASGAILDGVTITVDSGSTLNISKNDEKALNIGAATINGAGTVNLPSATAVSGAVSGTATLTVNGTVNVAADGSIANTLAGSGTLAFAAVPSSALTLGNWTGTVKLPAIASGAIIFNNYGTTGSTVSLTSMSGAWIDPNYTTINPKLYLDGNMTLTAMSTRTYTFAEIDGPGNLSFATSGDQPTAINITKVAEGYTGTISSTLETSVTIATLDRAVETSTAGGTKLLSTSGNVAASALTVGGAAQQVGLCTAADGIYVACTVTIPDVENASATVTVGGVAATGSSPYTVDVGSNVEITWTADSGYKITDGATQTINAIATDVTASAPTVEAKGATVSDVSVSYGADFATATVTATVSGDATGYTLTVGQNSYNSVVSGSTVTFSNVATGHASAYDSVSYTITATDGESAVPVTSGGSGSAVVADSDKWVDENSGTTRTAAAGGSWSNAVTYVDNAASIEDNTFTANGSSTGDCVTVTIDKIVYPALSDLTATISPGAQGAIAISTVGTETVTTNFYVLATDNVGGLIWNATAKAAAVGTEYNIEFTFDYAAKKYSVKVGGTPLIVDGNSTFDLCADKTNVAEIDFLGAGTLHGITGINSLGYMVRDAKGTFYATVQAAIQAYNKANGPYVLLRAGTPTDDCKFITEGGVTILKKLVKGMFFLAL